MPSHSIFVKNTIEMKKNLGNFGLRKSQNWNILNWNPKILGKIAKSGNSDADVSRIEADGRDWT